MKNGFRWGPSGGVRGEWGIIEDKVGARSDKEILGWSVKRRFVMFCWSAVPSLEANMGGARNLDIMER